MAITTFLFWNLNRKPLESVVASLAIKHEVDVLILAECTISPEVMLTTLNREKGVLYDLPFSQCKRITIYTRFSSEFSRVVRETRRLTIRRLTMPARTEITLAAVHFADKQYWRNESQSLECTRLAHEIRRAENDVGDANTVLVGDLNMNPFEPGIIGAQGLHAMVTREIALRKSRVIQGEEYQFFYNPMWKCFSDATPGPAGTYYAERAEPYNFFWNIFDQVMLRPNLLPLFRNEDLEILTENGNVSFLSDKGLPDNSVASDHLPILFKLNL